ncbi:MAG: leucine-rich repeat domain-containing protein [Bacteroidota bacterium]
MNKPIRYYIIDCLPRLAVMVLHIATISLSACHVSTEIDKQQGGIENRNVDLSRNGLNSVPLHLAQNRNIEKLILFRNHIDSLPAFIGGMDSLEKLSLKSNELVYVDSNAMNLPSLKELDLRFNRLEHLPDAFTGMLELEVLDLRNNKLKSLPPSIGALKNLQQLYLTDNVITTLPSTIQGLKRLKFLVIGKNSIEERLPDWIGEMESLVELDVSGCCNDNRLPESLSRLRNLELLTVSPYQVLPNDLGKGNSRLRIQVK